MNDGVTPADLMAEVIRLAAAAGDEVLRYYGNTHEVRIKEDHTPVTEADLAAHHTLSRGLAVLNPQWPILSEEGAAVPFGERSGWRQYWLIDPLDGTREFMRQNGEFSINVALIRDHRPVLGVVHRPTEDATYYASEDQGAYVATPASRRRLHTAQRRDVPVVAVSHYRPGATLTRFLNNLGEHRLVRMGSSLKSCLVAEAVADVYPAFGPTSEWDTGAAQCILEQAGGAIVDTDGRALQYNRHETLRNPRFFATGKAHDWGRYL